MLAGVIYGLCAITSGVCAWLLLRAWRRQRLRLLLWGGLCFCGFTLSNLLLVIDKVMTGPEVDLAYWRYGISLASVLVLLYGLIWDTE